MLPRLGSTLFTLCTLAAALVASASQADAGQRFSNPKAIIVPDATAGGPGLAPVEPSSIIVAQQLNPADRVTHVQVELRGVIHPRLADLDVLLVPPAGSGRPAVLLVSDVSGSNVSDWTARLSDEAYQLISNPYSSYSYWKPTDFAPADSFPGLPAIPITTDLSSLIGMDPVGTWQLWVVDDEAGQAGAIADGWQLSFDLGPVVTDSTLNTITSPASAGQIQKASPWGSTLSVAGVTGDINWMRVTLQGLTHARPDDLEAYLKAPNGRCMLLMRDVGGATPVSGLDVAFDFNGTRDFDYILNEGPLISGTYRPNADNHAPDTNLDPAETGCTSFSTYLVDLDNAAANGTWTLFLVDDTPGADGSLAGWTLQLGQERNDPILTTSGSSIDKPAITASLAGSIYNYVNSSPVDALRWRLELKDTDTYAGMPTYTAEGPWTPLPGGPAQTGPFSFTDIPLHWGYGGLCADARTIYGSIVSSCTSVRLPQPQYTLSEGATGSFFDLDVAIFNPNDTAAHADIQFLKRSGEVITQAVDLAPKGRKRINVEEIAGLEAGEVSTVVLPSTVTPLVVERSMFWDTTRYGGHGANATEPAKNWYFAEGAQGFYRTYVLLANPNDTPANVTLRFLIEGGKPKDHTLTVGAHARETVDASTIPALASQAFGITVTSSQKIVAERAMYFNQGGRLWEGGHESTGVSEPASSWLLAEGATGSFFTTFVLVSNPNSWETEVKMEFLKEDGSIVRKSYPLAGYGRLSVNIRGEHSTLAATGVSTFVTSNSAIVVERAMYWPGSPLEWTEAHNGFGLTSPAPKWGLADGRVGGALGYATYILLANSGDDPAFVNVLFSLDDGQQVLRTFKVEPHSRRTIDAGAELKDVAPTGTEFSNVITTDADTPIAVERATYWNSTDGRHWAGGSNVQGTKLP